MSNQELPMNISLSADKQKESESDYSEEFWIF